jgi:hypothetical protein
MGHLNDGTDMTQGYEILKEEVDISLEEFRDKFADPEGLPE